jgi:hypothetical protein
MNRLINRRRLLSATTAAALLPCLPALAGTLPEIVVNKDPYCGCCGAWIDHLRQAGFPATGVDVDDLSALKERLGVPAALASCHTGQVAGYVIEGHVPADEVVRLLAERPAATGLAVPDMPIGSPGMEVPGMAPDTYEVVLFGPSGTATFARYRGGERLDA